MLGIYCRTSKQRELKYTIENQKDGGIKCAQKLGLNYQIYIDDGISGTLDDSVRDGLAELFKDMRSRELTHIYVIDQSRIERESNTWGLFVSLCLNHEVKYFPAGSEYNLDDLTNRMLANVMSIFNAYYAEITSKKVRLANAKKASLGLTHGLQPFGYTKDQNKKYKVLESEAKYVRLMFKLSLEGNGAYTIANILNEKGVPTKFSGNFKGTIKRKDEYTKEVRYFDKENVKWRGNVISDILKNTIYKGERVWRRHEDKTEYINGKSVKRKVVAEVITVEVTKIIEPELFDKVQANFEKNRKNVGRRDEYNYLLNGLLYCEKCGRIYRGKKRLKGNDNAYKCSGKIYPNASCDSRGIGIPKIDSFIIRYLFMNKEFRNRIAEINKTSIKANDFTDSIFQHESEKTKIKKSLKHLYEVIADPDFDNIDELKSKIKALRIKEKNVNEKIEILKEKQANSDSVIIENRIKNEIKSVNPERSNKKLNLDFEQVKKSIHKIIDWVAIDHKKLTKGGIFSVKIKIKNLDEFHLFEVDWKLEKWKRIQVWNRSIDQTIQEMLSRKVKNDFDIRKEIALYENNVNKDFAAILILDEDDIYEFD